MRKDSEKVAILGCDDGVRRERANNHHHWENSDNKRQFVADHLCNRTLGAEHGKFIIATPAGHENGKLGGRTDGEEE